MLMSSESLGIALMMQKSQEGLPQQAVSEQVGQFSTLCGSEATMTYLSLYYGPHHQTYKTNAPTQHCSSQISMSPPQSLVPDTPALSFQAHMWVRVNSLGIGYSG